MTDEKQRGPLDPIPTEVFLALPKRERQLQVIGDNIANWLRWVTDQYTKSFGEAQQPPPDTHVMLNNGYQGAPPMWPNVGQLSLWLDVLREGVCNGWREIASDPPPAAMSVHAARFDEECGEWCYTIVSTQPSRPFTHWRLLEDPPRWPRLNDEDVPAMVKDMKHALVQAAIPLEALLLCRTMGAVELSERSWSEIENGVAHIRAALERSQGK